MTEMARQTPEQKLMEAFRLYAESEGHAGMVTEFAAVLFIEDATGESEYLHVTSHRSSWHSLYGLVQRLYSHVSRKLLTGA